MTIDCVAGEGSVTFYYPMTLHSSAPNTSPEGTHRRVVGHRMRRAGLTIPAWEWPTDWEWFARPATPESGFDLNPIAG